MLSLSLAAAAWLLVCAATTTTTNPPPRRLRPRREEDLPSKDAGPYPGDKEGRVISDDERGDDERGSRRRLAVRRQPADEEAGEVYVSLQFDPFRALCDATRRVRWALGVAWRRLSAAVKRRSQKREAQLEAKRRRRKRVRGAATLNTRRISSSSSRRSDAADDDDASAREKRPTVTAPLTAATALKVARLCRTRGAPVVIRAGGSAGPLFGQASALGFLTWDASDRFDAGLDFAQRSSALPPRKKQCVVWTAFAVPSATTLSVVALRTAPSAQSPAAVADASEASDWLRRCAEASAKELADLKTSAFELKLKKTQAAELRSALEAQSLERQRLEDERRAAEARERVAEQRVATRRAIMDALPPEPPATATDAIVVAVRDATGAKKARRFDEDATTDTVRDWVFAVLDVDLLTENDDGSSPKFVLRQTPKGTPLPRGLRLAHDVLADGKRRLLLECLPVSSSSSSSSSASSTTTKRSVKAATTATVKKKATTSSGAKTKILPPSSTAAAAAK